MRRFSEIYQADEKSRTTGTTIPATDALLRRRHHHHRVISKEYPLCV